MKRTYKNRFIKGAFILFSALFIFSCASKSKANETEEVVEEGEVIAGEILSAENEEIAVKEVSAELPAEISTDAVIAEAVEEQAETENDEGESEDSETKWYRGLRKYDFKMGNLRVKIRPNKGTFNILAKNEKGSYIPLLSTANEYMTSSFYLKAGKNILKLNENAAVETAARKTNDGVQIKYSINRVADVIVDFAFLKSDEQYDFDMLKITTTVVNIGSRDWDCGVKLVLDTVLGESSKNHFFDSNNKPVKNELCLRDLKDSKWFVSKNSSAALQLIFDGKDVTPPSLVALANYATLDNATWEPDMLSYRTFDTVLSYSNSAVGVMWPSKVLKPEESYSDIFYISVATDEKEPSGAAVICAEAAVVEETPVVEEYSNVEETVKPVVQTIPAASDGFGNVARPADITSVAGEVIGAAQETVKAEEPAPVVTNTEKTVSPDFEVKSISDEQVTSDYINELLSRISKLEDSGDNVNREELLMLNAELDSILEYLRKN